MSARALSIRRWAVRILILLTLAAAGFGVFHLRQTHAGPAVPSASAREGDFLVLVRCRGALKARRSVGIYTPTVPNLRIAWLAPTGEHVNAGDPILRFDSSTARQQLMQTEAQLKQAQATLDQAVAQTDTTAEQDQTQLADSRFSVERADVEVSKQEILSRIAAEEAKVALGIAQQRLKVQEATVESHKTSSNSRIASLARQRDKVKFDVDITTARIAQMEIKAPISGLLTLRNNCSGAITSADCKPYKVGDNVSSGMVLGEIPDLNTLELDSKLEEADRGRVAANNDVIVRVDSLPELTIPAKVTEVSALAEMRMEYPYTPSFRAYAALLRPDPRLRPDMNGGMDIVINRIPGAISIPAKALFTRAGKPIVYLGSSGAWRPTDVQVLARNPDEVAISGIPGNAKVALVDVTKQEAKK
jgi:HlyD family secretion protein